METMYKVGEMKRGIVRANDDDKVRLRLLKFLHSQSQSLSLWLTSTYTGSPKGKFSVIKQQRRSEVKKSADKNRITGILGQLSWITLEEAVGSGQGIWLLLWCCPILSTQEHQASSLLSVALLMPEFPPMQEFLQKLRSGSVTEVTASKEDPPLCVYRLMGNGLGHNQGAGTGWGGLGYVFCLG